jgi:hypothetical protein
MLRELLRLVEAAEGPISLSDLARQLGVDVPVLDGMLQHWVRKGRLVVEGSAGAQGGRGAGQNGDALTLPLLTPAPLLPCSPAVGGCGGCGSCSGMANCPFVARLPVTYRLNLNE